MHHWQLPVSSFSGGGSAAVISSPQEQGGTGQRLASASGAYLISDGETLAETIQTRFGTTAWIGERNPNGSKGLLL